MSETVVDDGQLVIIDPDDERTLRFNWNDELTEGVAVDDSAFKVVCLKPAPAAVSSITRSGSTATVTTTEPHGMQTGDWATIAGAGQSEYNITAVATVLTPTTFTVQVTGSPATPATGTITFGWGLGLDSDVVLESDPYNGRYTFLRVIGGGERARGRKFEVANRIVTDEDPTQTLERSFFALIENQ